MRNGSVVFLRFAPIVASVLVAFALAVIVLLALNGTGGFSASPVQRVAPFGTATPQAHAVVFSPTDTMDAGAGSHVDVSAPESCAFCAGAGRSLHGDCS